MTISFTGFLGVEWTDVVIDENSGTIVWTNFSGNSVPGASDDVLINASGVIISGTVFDHHSEQTGRVATRDLQIAPGGSLTADYSQMTIHGSLLNEGSFTVSTDRVKVLGGIVNNHLVTIDGNSGSSYLLMDAGEFYLTGTGNLRLASNADGTAYLTGTDGEITDFHNEGRVSGTGYIGWSNQQYYPGGYVSITNSGIIDANVSARKLIIAQGTSDANPLSNTGSLVANGGGELVIDNAYVLQSGSGTIGAYGPGSKAFLNNVSLKGGYLDTSGAGAIQLETGFGYAAAGGGPGYTILDGSTASGAVTITGNSLVRVGTAGQGGTEAQIKGSIVNRGEIGLLGYFTALRVDTSAKLTGGGDVVLSYAAGAGGNTGGAMLQGASDSTASTLENVDNHIHGAGYIGRYDYGVYAAKLLSVINRADGVIEADVASAPLVINRTVSFANEGVLRASNGAELSIGSNIANPAEATVIDNEGGRIVATGIGSDVVIRGGTVRGGTLDTDNGGEIQLVGSTFSILDGATSQGSITNEGTLRIDGGLFRGSIINNGVIGFNPTTAATLYIDTDGVTLSGNGTLTLRENSMIVGESNGTDATLVNAGTIAGSGYIGTTPNGPSGLLTFTNQAGGVVRANASGSTMTIDMSGTIRNAGLFEAKGGALQLGHNTGSLSDMVDVDNKGGRIVATGAASEVVLKGGTVRGGTLDTASGGVIRLENHTFSVLDGATAQGAVTNSGTLRIDGGMFRGAIANSGSIGFHPTNAATLYIAEDDVTLSGTGVMTLGAGTMIRGESSSETSVLSNAGTIVGGGYIGTTPNGSGSERLTLDNRVGGVVRATAGKTMIVDTSGTIQNAGLLEANGGSLDLRDLISGTGTVRATNGGTLLVRGDWTGTVTFAGSGSETLRHGSGASWTAGKTITLKGFGLGDRIDLAGESGYAAAQPDTFTWLQSGENGTFRFSVSGTVRSFVFEGLSQLHVRIVDNGEGGVFLQRVATIDGNSGSNTLSGTTGHDRMVGFAGNDTFRGSAGNDLMDGGTGIDTVDYAAATGAIRVSLATTALQAVGGGQGSDSVRFIENIVGGRFADTITGDALANILKGGGGNDTLNGGKGIDRLEGGTGNDTFVVDDTRDIVVELSNQGTDTVQASASYTLASNVENLTLIGSANLNGTGNALANILVGNSGKNTLKGGAGSDTLTGGDGADLLYGGTGRDTFAFLAPSNSRVGASDKIFDFSVSEKDRISLKAIDANSKVGGDQAFSFIGENPFQKKAGELRFEKKSGDTYVHGDVSGDGKADFTIVLDTVLSLRAADFVL